MRFKYPLAKPPPKSTSRAPMKTWMCLICGYVYDEATGDPDADLPPGTAWDDVPLSWRCPDCGAGKEDFEMTEI
jgi:rubredoxin